MLHHLTPRVFWVQDTCTVYGVRGATGLALIDCGTDLTAGDLATEGAVEELLLTHFHRDQCATARRWQREGARVTMPFAERGCFEEADLLGAAYDPVHNYAASYAGRGPLGGVRADRYARDYGTVEWSDMSFSAVPLPGHTPGSVGYLFSVDGQRFLACGDLMSAPGKIRDYFWLQWKYMDFAAHVNLLESLETAEGLEADWILPGHGEPFRATPQAFGELRQALVELFELFHARPYVPYRPRFRRITPHVHEVSNSIANCYVVQQGEHALLVDCGFTSGAPVAPNPHRFIDRLTPALEGELGIRSVEWFLPTHYHDDHLGGYPALRARYGTRVAAAPELRDILEHPERYDMPCLVPEGLEVHRVVGRHEAFHWRGIDFRIEQYPGQTLYHQLISFVVDDTRYLCVGDNISGLALRADRDYIFSFIPKNRTPIASYADMPWQILDRAPDWLLTGHGGAVPFDRGKVERWADWMARWEAAFARIIDQPHPDLGMDPQWIEFHPYKVRVRPGDSVRFELRITNHEPASRVCEVRFRGAAGVWLEPGEARVEVPPGQVTAVAVTARFPDAFSTHSLPIVADVTWGGRRLGEVAEAIACW
jgi:glyoxylase-like metal-dependent hydrolase (beta-lactamase superfamily II)